MVQVTREQTDDAARGLDRPRVLAKGEIGRAKIGVGENTDDRVPKRGGDFPGTLAMTGRLIGTADGRAGSRHECGNEALAPRVSESLREGLQFAKELENPWKFAEGYERAPQIQADVERLRDRAALLRNVAQRFQRLIKVGDCLSVGRSRDRLVTRLPAIVNGLQPTLAPLRMMSESFDVFEEALAIECREGINDTTVQSAASILEETRIGHLVGKRVLEGVFEVREQTPFVEEFSGLQGREAHSEVVFRKVSDRCQQSRRHDLADHCGRLQQLLVLLG